MSKVHIDLEKRTASIGSRQYVFRLNEHYDSDYDSEFAKIMWYQENQKYAIFVDAHGSDSEEDESQRIPVGEAEKMDHTREEWSLALDRITDLDLIRRLTRAFYKEDSKAKARRKEMEQVVKWLARNLEALRPPGRALVVTKLPKSISSKDQDVFDWDVTCRYERYLHISTKKLKYGWWKVDEDGPIKIETYLRLKKALRDSVLQHKQERKSRRSDEDHSAKTDEMSKHTITKETEVPKRTKWGVRVWSNDKKHYLAVGVWKSTKYEDCTTVRLSVAGANYMYTLDKTQLETLRSELSRGVPT